MTNLEKLNKIIWTEQELLQIKNRIMKRIQMIWFLKKVLMPTSFVLAVSGLVLFYAIKAQHAAVILENISERAAAFDFLGLLKYFMVAVQKTELDLFAISVSATLLAIYFGRRLIRETLNFWFRGAPAVAFSERNTR